MYGATSYFHTIPQHRKHHSYNGSFVKVIDSKDNIPVSISPGSKVRQVLITRHPRPQRFERYVGTLDLQIFNPIRLKIRFSPMRGLIFIGIGSKISPEDACRGAVKRIGILSLGGKAGFDVVTFYVIPHHVHDVLAPCKGIGPINLGERLGLGFSQQQRRSTVLTCFRCCKRRISRQVYRRGCGDPAEKEKNASSDHNEAGGLDQTPSCTCAPSRSRRSPSGRVQQTRAFVVPRRHGSRSTSVNER